MNRILAKKTHTHTLTQIIYSFSKNIAFKIKLEKLEIKIRIHEEKTLHSFIHAFARTYIRQQSSRFFTKRKNGIFQGLAKVVATLFNIRKLKLKAKFKFKWTQKTHNKPTAIWGKGQVKTSSPPSSTLNITIFPSVATNQRTSDSI